MAENGIFAGHPGQRPRCPLLPGTSPLVRVLPLFFLILPLLLSEGAGVCGAAQVPEPATTAVLERIRDEVASLGKRPGDEVLTWDFHIGPADDDTNQAEHVVVIIQDLGSGTRMTIQVTELEPASWNSNIRYGRTSKTVVCLFRGKRAEIERSDFDGAELDGKLAGVLEAVLNKKRLLKSGRELGGRNTQST